MLQKVNTSDPFDLLLDIEQRCMTNAAGLPTLDESQEEWVGVGFRIGEDKLIAPMSEIQEILDLPEFTFVPGVKSWMVGVANVRGSLLPLMDLKGFVTGEVLKNLKEGRVLVVKHQGMNTGLIVDEVLGLRHFSLSEQASQLPDVGKALKPFIKQSFQRNNQHWPVFSFHTLVEDERFQHAAL